MFEAREWKFPSQRLRWCFLWSSRRRQEPLRPLHIVGTRPRFRSLGQAENRVQIFYELISLTDGCSQIIWSRDFLIGQGYEVGPAVVYQDNMSTMAMVKSGKPTSDRTRHIHVRYFFVKDRVESGEIEIRHMDTDNMTADFLSKPLVGAKFQKLKQKLLNWYYWITVFQSKECVVIFLSAIVHYSDFIYFFIYLHFTFSVFYHSPMFLQIWIFCLLHSTFLAFTLWNYIRCRILCSLPTDSFFSCPLIILFLSW